MNTYSIQNTFRSYTLLDMKMLNHARKTQSISVHKILNSSNMVPHTSTLDGIRNMKNYFTWQILYYTRWHLKGILYSIRLKQIYNKTYHLLYPNMTTKKKRKSWKKKRVRINKKWLCKFWDFHSGLRILVFWDVTPCHWASGFHYFEGMYCLQLQQFKFHGEATQHHIPKDWNLRNEKPYKRITSCIKDFLKVYNLCPCSFHIFLCTSWMYLRGSLGSAALANQNRRLRPFLYHLSPYMKERCKYCV